MCERKHSETHSKSNIFGVKTHFSPPVGVGLLDFKKKSTPSSSLLLVSQNVNRNVNQNVNRNVSREPNSRYTTILLQKMKENEKNVSREPDFRYTTILLSKMKENYRKYTPTIRKR